MWLRRRRDRDGIEIVPRDQLQRVRVHIRDSGRFGAFVSFLARAAAEGDDLPAFGAERGNVDLHAESEADDADASVC